MMYHLFKSNVPDMSKLDRFQHAVTVRNRQYGPGAATTPSPHLDLEITDDNRRMLALNVDDVNMHTILRESTCKRGQRRRVAKRCLNALGGVSGVAGFLNDEEKLVEIKAQLKFAESLETVKHAEKTLKVEKATQARKVDYGKAKKKCGLKRDDKFTKSHVQKLTCKQMVAVAFIDFCGKVITGKAAELREQLTQLFVDVELGVPEYPTQDEVYDEPSSDGDSSDSAAIRVDLELDELTVNEGVEVFWKGDDCWYKGVIQNVDLDDRTFQVEYLADKQVLWHKATDYKVRVSS